MQGLQLLHFGVSYCWGIVGLWHSDHISRLSDALGEGRGIVGRASRRP